MIRRLELAHRRGDPRGRRVLDRRCRSSSTCSTSAILVIGGSYVLTRLGLTDLEAGYAVSQLHGHVGEQLRVTYTLRNAEPPAQAVAGGPQPDDPARRRCPAARSRSAARAERSWLVRVPLTRRGHFRIEPLQIRTGDPFGFFEASATVGQGVTVIVYPRIEPLPALAAAGGQHRGQPRGARADAPDDAARHDRPAVRARATLQPDPLEDDGPPRRDPGQGVRPRADRRRVDLPRPRARRSRPAGRRVDGRGRRPGRRRRSPTRRSVENRAVGHDRQRPPDGVLPAGPRRPPAPQGHAAPRGRRGRRQRRRCVEALVARPAPAAAGHDRRRHHAVARPRLGPAAGRPCGRGASPASSSSSTPRSVRSLRRTATPRPRSGRALAVAAPDQETRALSHALSEYEPPSTGSSPAGPRRGAEVSDERPAARRPIRSRSATSFAPRPPDPTERARAAPYRGIPLAPGGGLADGPPRVPPRHALAGRSTTPAGSWASSGWTRVPAVGGPRRSGLGDVRRQGRLGALDDPRARRRLRRRSSSPIFVGHRAADVPGGGTGRVVPGHRGRGDQARPRLHRSATGP